MELKATGTIKKIHKPQTFTKKDGTEISKSGFTITTDSKFNPDIYFDVFNENAKESLKEVNMGDQVDVEFNLNSREYQGRHFHNVVAWKITKSSAQMQEVGSDDPF